MASHLTLDWLAGDDSQASRRRLGALSALSRWRRRLLDVAYECWRLTLMVSVVLISWVLVDLVLSYDV